jgi:hypothetical protein
MFGPVDATLHAVVGCARRFEVGPTSFDNLELGPGAAAASRLALAPGWTLYCVDVEKRQALFLEIPPEADLSAAPFVFLMQERLARRALFVPFAALGELAEAVPAPGRVVLLFNIARCGSTLVSAMLNEVEGVWSLSEPDPFFDLVMRRHLLDPGEVPGLVGACARLSFRPPPGRRVDTLAIKLRSQSLFQAEDFHVALPDAACVFLYRDALGWARSFWYFLQNIGVPLVLDGEMLRFHWWIMTAAADVALLAPYLDPDGSVPVERTLAPAWAMHLEAYLRLLAAGVPFLAVRYNELDADREGVAGRLLRHAGLPEAASGAAVRAFARDSQAGTGIAREKRSAEPFSEAAAAAFLAALARQARVNAPDMRLPDAYS